jgi:hypothetical protein
MLTSMPRVFDPFYEQMEQLVNAAFAGTTEMPCRVYLPADIDADRVDASLTDGVLTVTAPKATTEKNRHIEIKG